MLRYAHADQGDSPATYEKEVGRLKGTFVKFGRVEAFTSHEDMLTLVIKFVSGAGHYSTLLTLAPNRICDA